MRLHRFFIEKPLRVGEKVKIENDTLIHQWRRVLRFKVGQEVILFNNSGSEFHGVLVSFADSFAEVEIKSSQPGNISQTQLFLYLSLAKRDSFEWTLEKGTELGVSGFVPVISERSEKKNVNMERTKKIITEAAEQSGRVTLPEISEPLSLEKSFDNLSGKTFALDPRGEQFKIADYKTNERVNVFIGPEGGFSTEEIDLLRKQNIPVLSFSHNILRAETAAVAIASLLLIP